MTCNYLKLSKNKKNTWNMKIQLVQPLSLPHYNDYAPVHKHLLSTY